MLEKKGVNGREVPGATPADDSVGEQVKKRVRGGRSRNKKKKANEDVAPTEGLPPSDHIENASLTQIDGAADEPSNGEPLNTKTVNGGATTVDTNGETKFSKVGDISEFVHPYIIHENAASNGAYLDGNHVTDEPHAEDFPPSGLDPEEAEQPEEDGRRIRIREWFEAQDAQPFRNLSKFLPGKIIDFIFEWKYPVAVDGVEDCTTRARQMIWRAVVRANYFWVNPETGLETGKPKPVLAPDGSYEHSFDVFVMCAAARADRIGRDMPTAEWVKDVEDDLRMILTRAEKAGRLECIEHLAFVLMFEEDRKKVLSRDQFRRRINAAGKSH